MKAISLSALHGRLAGTCQSAENTRVEESLNTLVPISQLPPPTANVPPTTAGAAEDLAPTRPRR